MNKSIKLVIKEGTTFDLYFLEEYNKINKYALQEALRLEKKDRSEFQLEIFRKF